MAAAVSSPALTSQPHDLWLEQAATEGAMQARRPVSGGHMRRGEVWWADFDERRAVVLLSGEEAAGFLAMQVVAPAGTDLSGVAVEVTVGAPEGLPLEGVLRVALPRPGLIPCTWLVTLTREDLIGQAGVLPSAKLGEIEDALRLGGLE
ncbi:type II toxin-antitoxin system PemK/MazF family toxin [Amycolatopsis vastitatis]|nr:type II toxin-antitoxin system PemK/MazF family toxin [Amycolatopsis vastitatis]